MEVDELGFFEVFGMVVECYNNYFIVGCVFSCMVVYLLNVFYLVYVEVC